jgi:TetR/AcrR family tetracycline transcriptional repressor
MATIITAAPKLSGRSDRREPLTRERVLTTALAIVDQDGLSKLSMRRLGAELGVDPMAVYYHVPSKAALLDGLVDAVILELGSVPPRTAGEDLTDWIVMVFTRFWHKMGEHPNVLSLMDTRPISGEAGMSAGEAILTEIERDGVVSEVAAQTLMLLTTITIALAQTRHARSQVFDDPDRRTAFLTACQDQGNGAFPKMEAGFMSGQTKDWQATLGFTLRSIMISVLAGSRPDEKLPDRCTQGDPPAV